MKILIWQHPHFPCDTDNENWGNSFIISTGFIGIYPFTWLFDPFLLPRLPSDFSISLVTELAEGDLATDDLLILPHRDPHFNDAILRSHLEAGGKAVVIDARPEQLRCHPQLRAVNSRGRCLSNCETWIFDGLDQRWQYPQGIWFELFQNLPEPTRLFTTIGEWPDLAVFQNLMWTATDAVQALELYHQDYAELNADGFVDHFTGNFVRALGILLNPMADFPPASEWRNYFDLRRDFHALGFAYQTLTAGAVLENDPTVVPPVLPQVRALAQEFVQNLNVAHARTGLKSIFHTIQQACNQLYPFPRYFIDGIHGGIAYENYGFAEYDYPEKSNHYIETYLNWADGEHYKFHLQIGMSTHEVVARRFPAFYQKLKAASEAGRMEVVDGSYGQLYPQFFSTEANVRQLVYGQAVAQQLFGQRVEQHVRQEFGHTPQHPNLLQQCGYQGVLHRTQNWGATPQETVPAINWVGQDGSVIRAITATPAGDEHHPVDFFWWLPEFFHQTKVQHIAAGIYSNFLDLFWIPPFREELIRSAKYGPILGEFITLRELWRRLPPELPARQYQMADYRYTIFSQYGWGGTLFSSFYLTAMAENLLTAIETLGAFASPAWNGLQSEIDAAWKALAAFHNHDSFCVPQTNIGGHTREFRGLLGPGRRYTEVEIGSKLVRTALQSLLPRYAELLQSQAEPTRPAPAGVTAFNPFPWEIATTGPCWRLEQAAAADSRHLAETEIVLHNLPALGMHRGGVDAPDWRLTGKDLLENRHWRVRFDADQGAIRQIEFKPRGQRLLGPQGAQLTFQNAASTATQFGIFESASGAKAESKGWLALPDGTPISYFEQTWYLWAASARLDYRLHLVPTDAFFEKPQNLKPPFSKHYFVPFNQWEHAIGLTFDLLEPTWTPRKIFLNVLTEPGTARFQSPLALVLTHDPQHLIWHHGGHQHFTWQNQRLSQVVLHPREEQRTFRGGLELMETPANIFRQITAFQLQPILVAGAAATTSVSPKLELTPENVLTTAVIRQSQDQILVRLIETAGQKCEAELKVTFPVRGAVVVDHLGQETGENLRITEQVVQIPLKAWEIRTIKICIGSITDGN
ncbi:glycosyl hydrolase-related protein [candidate division KSB1 bacterium]|nr:glycosyl hydrolase-related protein [candidate division KSB1 bacterium]